MAKLSLVQKQKLKQKYKVRQYNRCPNCGRARGYMRRFNLCRICFRDLASKGYITGVRKSSW